MVFFMGLNVDVKIKMSPFAFSTASCSLRPTTESGGMLPSKTSYMFQLRLWKKYTSLKKLLNSLKKLSSYWQKKLRLYKLLKHYKDC